MHTSKFMTFVRTAALAVSCVVFMAGPAPAQDTGAGTQNQPGQTAGAPAAGQGQNPTGTAPGTSERTAQTGGGGYGLWGLLGLLGLTGLYRGRSQATTTTAEFNRPDYRQPRAG